MAEDFLNKVSRKALEQLKNLKSPYQSEMERTETVRLHMGIYKEVKRIAFKNDEEIANALEKIIRGGLAKRK